MRRAALATLVALVLAATGCSSAGREYTNPQELRGDEAIVVGRFRATAFGHEVTDLETYACVDLLFESRADKDATFEVRVPKDGVFAAVVPAGDYTIGTRFIVWDGSVHLSPEVTLANLTLNPWSYTCIGWNSDQTQVWRWGPTDFQTRPFDGTVAEVSLKPCQVYWLGDRRIGVDAEAFKEGPKSLRLSTRVGPFWTNEADFRGALSRKYPTLDLTTFQRVPGDGVAARDPAPGAPTAPAPVDPAPAAPLPNAPTPNAPAPSDRVREER